MIMAVVSQLNVPAPQYDPKLIQILANLPPIRKQRERYPLERHDGSRSRLFLRRVLTSSHRTTDNKPPHGQTQKPTSHPVASALKICISSKRLQSDVGKKALLEIQRQNKVRDDKVRGKQIGTLPQDTQRVKLLFPEMALSFDFFRQFVNFPVICQQQIWSYCARALRLTAVHNKPS